jgi:hypothetical protein
MDSMKNLKVVLTAAFVLLTLACSHPIEIVGDGDVTSASGTRNCYLEDFKAGKENCSKNMVINAYQETYYATPRAGWKFDKWMNCQTAVGNKCSFNIPSDTVAKAWGETAPALVAVFSPMGESRTPWVGNWVQVNFLSDDDNGVWDEDDKSPEGIGFVALVTQTQWIDKDNYGLPGGCAVTYDLSVDANKRYLKTPTAVEHCPFTLDQLLFLHSIDPETGQLEFADGNRFMIDSFDPSPYDDVNDPECCLVAFKYRRQ